jgi:hypothetical protein
MIRRARRAAVAARLGGTVFAERFAKVPAASAITPELIDAKVISLLIFDLKESGELGAIAILGLSMLFLTFAVVIFVNRIRGFGGSGLRNT